MLSLVEMNSGGNGGEYTPVTTDPDPDPDPGGRPMSPPAVIEGPFRRHHVSSITTQHPRAA